MTIETSPILLDRKNLVQRIGENKQIENYILTKPSEARTMRLPYDARTELDMARHSLDLSLIAKPMFFFWYGTTEGDGARMDGWYDARLSDINKAEQQYRQGVAQAEKSGAITTSEANGLLVDLSSPFPTNPFERARREARGLYRKERKFWSPTSFYYSFKSLI